MKIKVCGMRQRENIEQLVSLNPDYIGFIFHPQSKRYIGNQLSEEVINLIPARILKVGVFVDEPFDSLLEQYCLNNLDLVQLHGNEQPEYCDQLQKRGIGVIKAFKIADDFNFDELKSYESCCDYFLFDTAGDTPGGTGIKFDWRLIHHYKGDKSFFLSGGIGLSDLQAIRDLTHSKLIAVDVNSAFETEPAVKDISKLNAFIEGLNTVD